MRKRKKLLKILRKAIYDIHEELIFEANVNKEVPVSYSDTLEIKKIDRENSEPLIQFYYKFDLGGRDSAKVIQRCFELNHKCFAAIKNGDIVGYIWWGDHTLRFDREDPDEKFLDDGILNLTKDDVYVFFLFVSPEHRSRNTAIKLILSFVTELRKSGYSRVYGYVALNNLPAYYVCKLLGADTQKRIPVHRYFLFILFKNNKFYWDRAGHKGFINSLKKLLKKK